MRGHNHFKFEQYKLWCKNHHKKACEYVNFKTFIELNGSVKEWQEMVFIQEDGKKQGSTKYGIRKTVNTKVFGE